jgi:hypothetical protein
MRTSVFLILACLVTVFANEAVRNRYGFISNSHFWLFWTLWASAIVGMAVAIGLALTAVL